MWAGRKRTSLCIIPCYKNEDTHFTTFGVKFPGTCNHEAFVRIKTSVSVDTDMISQCTWQLLVSLGVISIQLKNHPNSAENDKTTAH